MSTYTHRYIEIQREMIDGIRWKFERLPDPETVVGKIYKISEYNLPEGIHRYYKSEKNGEGKAEWVPLENVEKKWVPVRWYFEKSDIDQGETNMKNNTKHRETISSARTGSAAKFTCRSSFCGVTTAGLSVTTISDMGGEKGCSKTGGYQTTFPNS